MKPIIDIILDGELFACREWEIIPRVGELVLLKKGDVWARVEQVLWGDDSAAPSSINRQWIHLVCKKTGRPN